VRAPIAPGKVEVVEIEKFELLRLYQRIEIVHKPSIIALDGEREIRILPKDDVEVELDEKGPLIVNFEKVLQKAVQKKLFLINS
jgi:hypothetical protein